MSDLRQNLRTEFQNPDYRYAYAESFLNTKLATQIRVLRQQRDKTQDELGAVTGTRQSGFSRFENVNHSAWKTDTLWKIARALGVRLNISFETFGSLIDEKERFSKEYLQRPDFSEDPAFREEQISAAALAGIAVRPETARGFHAGRPFDAARPLGRGFQLATPMRSEGAEQAATPVAIALDQSQRVTTAQPRGRATRCRKRRQRRISGASEGGSEFGRQERPHRSRRAA